MDVHPRYPLVAGAEHEIALEVERHRELRQDARVASEHKTETDEAHSDAPIGGFPRRRFPRSTQLRLEAAARFIRFDEAFFSVNTVITNRRSANQHFGFSGQTPDEIEHCFRCVNTAID